MNKIITGLKNLDKDTYKIIKYGILFSTFLAIIASAILISYILLGINLFYHIGEVLIKSSFKRKPLNWGFNNIYILFC